LLVRGTRSAAAAVIVGLLLTAATAGAQTVTTLYAATAAPLFRDGTGQQMEGSITPGTPVEVAANATQSFVAVTLRGWSQQGNATTLFAAPGQRIVLAQLAAGEPAPKILATRKDAYDNVWNQVEIAGFVKADALVADQKTVWAKAEKLYSTRCSACHALHHPDEFTANQWPKILATMTKNAALQPAEAALVTQYLQSQAK
jgi:trimethylamine-N-oxide reductase cytochrome c-type subunit TorC